MAVLQRLACSCAAFTLISTFGTGRLHAATHTDFANEKVNVTEETLAPGESETIAGTHPSVVVYLTGDAASTTLPDGSKQSLSITRGKTINQPAGAEVLANTGSSPVHLVRVELLTAGNGERWGAAGLAPNYKVLFEDRHSRTYDIRIPAREREPQHTHHDRVVICLSGAQLEHVLPDGRTQPSTLKTDEVAWRLGQTHMGHNLGDTDLWVIAIEPK